MNFSSKKSIAMSFLMVILIGISSNSTADESELELGAGQRKELLDLAVICTLARKARTGRMRFAWAPPMFVYLLFTFQSTLRRKTFHFRRLFLDNFELIVQFRSSTKRPTTSNSQNSCWTRRTGVGTKSLPENQDNFSALYCFIMPKIDNKLEQISSWNF